MSFPPVADLVPHETPILAVEELLAWEPGHARATMVVRDHGVFVRDGFVAAEACVEYIAQAVAACLGYEAYLGGDGVRVGMVIASRKLELSRARIAVGERLDLEVRCERGNDEVSTYTGDATDEHGEVVASALLTLIHPKVEPLANDG